MICKTCFCKVVMYSYNILHTNNQRLGVYPLFLATCVVGTPGPGWLLSVLGHSPSCHRREEWWHPGTAVVGNAAPGYCCFVYTGPRGRSWRAAGTFETNGTASLRRLFQKSARAGRGGGPWTDVRDGPLGWTFETNGVASLRRLFQKSARAGHGGGPWTDVRDGPPGWTLVNC